jgi:hypothetical protein
MQLLWPITWQMLLEEVLLRELTCILIAEDLDIGVEDASRIMFASGEFRRNYHHDDGSLVARYLGEH